MKERAAAIIPAAGSGIRMNSDVAKQFLDLAGKPILVHTLIPFSSCPFISQIIVVVPADQVAATSVILQKYNLLTDATTVIAGGRRRQDSVHAGLQNVHEDIDVVLVHDGVRPLVSVDLITRCYLAICETGAAIAAIPVKDTLKRADAQQDIAATVDRQMLWQAQTPQGARKALLQQAFSAWGEAAVTDEATLLEQAGVKVRLVHGAERNLKITRPEDLAIALSIMNTISNTPRIGHGFDAHRFADGRQLILGGVRVAHHLGLDGHSDADVVTHALCDALLGAMGLGDIGNHFPDTDASFKNILSLKLLDEVINLAQARQLSLINADITIVCQTPRLARYIQAMREKLSTHCRSSSECINIKATTTEKMGFTGREEGICCHAVVLLHHNYFKD